MIRAVCLVSREYPPETAFGGIARMQEMTARALVGQGVAVHVITWDPTGNGRRTVADGVVVHRIAAPTSPVGGAPELDHLLWAYAVAAYYRVLDELVEFDVVIAPDYGGEAARLEPSPHTALVVALHATRGVVHPELANPRAHPADALAAAIERAALDRADLLVAPTPLVAERTAALSATTSVVVTPPFEVTAPAGAETPADRRGLEICSLGRLEPNKQPELVLAVTAELRSRGVDAHATFVGRDTPLGPRGDSYRRSVLLPEVERLGLGYDSVRFVEQLGYDGVRAHLAAAHCVVAPSRFENLHTVVLEALAAGIPVICGETSGLAGILGRAEGLVALATGDPAMFATAAADALLDPELFIAARAGVDRLAQRFDPGERARALLSAVDQLPRLARIADALRAPRRARPVLGAVMLAHNALPYTRRAVASVLHHTDVPIELVVVDNGSTDGTGEWLATITDRRVTVVSSPENLGVSGGRNAGLDALSGEEEYVVFLDNDVEVLARWWEPFIEALDADPLVAIAGEDGVLVAWTEEGRVLAPVPSAGVERCDVVVGFCMVMRRDAVRRIGRFDERLGLFWHDDDDYAMRAARVGLGLVRVSSRRVVHFEHRSSTTVAGIRKSPGAPDRMSEENQRYLAAKHARQRPNPTSPFLLLADAAEICADPSILATYGSAFTAADPAALVILDVGADPGAITARLEAAAAAAGFDVEDGPKLIVLTPPEAVDADLAVLAEEVHALLGSGPGHRAFAHLGSGSADDPGVLRELAAGAWRARPLVPVTTGA